MTAAPDLTTLSHAEKDALIVALFQLLAAAEARIAAQDERIAALEARLDELSRPPKTPDNSSKATPKNYCFERWRGAGQAVMACEGVPSTTYSIARRKFVDGGPPPAMTG